MSWAWAELVTKLGVNQTAVSDYETGAAGISRHAGGNPHLTFYGC